jgi:F-type H+-transporting ATPase subunit b
MLPLLLAVVEASKQAAAEPSVVDGLKETFGHFGVEWRLVAIQAFSFLIVLAVLYKFGIKPTVAAMEERNAKISAGLKHAEETQARLAAAQQESAEIVKKSQLEAARIVEDARKSAKEFIDRQTQEASSKANDILTKAQQAIELEHKKMLADARTEIARLVVTTTERVLAKKLSDADRAAYNDTAARELANV